MQVTIYNGTHLSFPLQQKFFVKEVTGSAVFTNDTKYNLKNSHQIDWNKLTGITFTPLAPDVNSLMVAWRYNLKTSMFEIGPFFNVNKTRIMPNSTEIISVPPGEKFYFDVDYNGVSIKYNNKSVYKAVPKELPENFFTSMRIDGWFGGVSVAPKTLIYNINFQ